MTVSAWVAERLFRNAVRRVPVTVLLPDGTALGQGGPVARLVRPAAFFARLGERRHLGFGEAFMAGDWTSPDPAAFLTPLAARVGALVPRPLQRLRRLVDLRKRPAERNTPSGARANIARHYDLSNDLFATFLDPSMTYSSAWFGPGDDLAAAQARKIDGILDLAGVGAGSRVLEIGTGWGSLAIRAARRGAHVTTLTISEAQLDLARQRIAAAGVADRVDARLCDYRSVRGEFDAVVSVEMIEAVGAEYWPTYFATLDRVLVPGGHVGLQAITMPHDRMLATRDAHTWMHEYVFPGGHLLSVPAIEELARGAALRITGRRSLGVHYARTLRCWRTAFLAAADEVAALGFDEVFRRLWEFYLAYCEAGFRANYLDAWQFRLTKP